MPAETRVRQPALVLVTGPEAILAERAVTSTLDERRHGSPDLDVIRVGGGGYEPGALVLDASPSLFGGDKAIVIEALDEAPDELVADVLDLVTGPLDGVSVVVVHRSGVRGKRVLDAMKGASARVIECPAIKTERDKTDFVVNEFRRQGRKATSDAVRALIEAVGKDVRELAAACAQLAMDTQGVVDERLVEIYHGGKVEATGFRVADAALAGQTAEALRLLRHAISTGVDPVPIVAVLASQLRILVKVGSAGRGSSSLHVAKSLGLAPWQVDKARRMVGHWEPEALATSIQAIAAADAEVKGGGRDPVYAVERAILTMGAARVAGRHH